MLIGKGSRRPNREKIRNIKEALGTAVPNASLMFRIFSRLGRRDPFPINISLLPF